MKKEKLKKLNSISFYVICFLFLLLSCMFLYISFNSPELNDESNASGINLTVGTVSVSNTKDVQYLNQGVEAITVDGFEYYTKVVKEGEKEKKYITDNKTEFYLEVGVIAGDDSSHYTSETFLQLSINENVNKNDSGNLYLNKSSGKYVSKLRSGRAKVRFNKLENFEVTDYSFSLHRTDNGQSTDSTEATNLFNNSDSYSSTLTISHKGGGIEGIGASLSLSYAPKSANVKIMQQIGDGTPTELDIIKDYKFLDKFTYTKRNSINGYTFDGWYTNINGSHKRVRTNDGNLLVYSLNPVFVAKYIPNNYSVVFNGNGYTSGTMENQYFVYDQQQRLNENLFIKSGYTFAGWATSSNGTIKYNNNVLVKNLTNINGGQINLYAQWKPNIYKVTLDNQGATTVGTTEYWYKYEYNNGDTYYYTNSNCSTPMSNSIVKPTKTGYTFGGYYTKTGGQGTSYINASGGCINNIYKHLGNITLYAQWTPKTYNISYNANGGNGSASGSATYNSPFTLRNGSGFSKTGYVFSHWSITQDGSNTGWNDYIGKPWTWTYDYGLTFYAQWAPISYTVTFNRNGAEEGIMNDQSLTYDSSKALSEYRRTSCVFDLCDPFCSERRRSFIYDNDDFAGLLFRILRK